MQRYTLSSTVQAARSDMQVGLTGQCTQRGAAELLQPLLPTCILLYASHVGSSALEVHDLRAAGMRRIQFAVEATLEILGHDRVLGLVALVEKRQPERLPRDRRRSRSFRPR